MLPLIFLYTSHHPWLMFIGLIDIAISIIKIGDTFHDNILPSLFYNFAKLLMILVEIFHAISAWFLFFILRKSSYTLSRLELENRMLFDPLGKFFCKFLLRCSRRPMIWNRKLESGTGVGLVRIILLPSLWKITQIWPNYEPLITCSHIFSRMLLVWQLNYLKILSVLSMLLPKAAGFFLNVFSLEVGGQWTQEVRTEIVSMVSRRCEAKTEPQIGKSC